MAETKTPASDLVTLNPYGEAKLELPGYGTLHLRLALSAEGQSRAFPGWQAIEDQVLELVRHNPGLSKNEVATGLDISPDLTTKAIKRLCRRGELVIREDGQAHRLYVALRSAEA